MAGITKGMVAVAGITKLTQDLTHPGHKARLYIYGVYTYMCISVGLLVVFCAARSLHPLSFSHGALSSRIALPASPYKPCCIVVMGRCGCPPFTVPRKHTRLIGRIWPKRFGSLGRGGRNGRARDCGMHSTMPVAVMPGQTLRRKLVARGGRGSTRLRRKAALRAAKSADRFLHFRADQDWCRD